MLGTIFRRVIFLWSLLHIGTSYCELINRDSEASGSEDGQENPVTRPIPPITVLEVRREIMDSGVKFTIKYKVTESRNVFIMWRDERYPHLPRLDTVYFHGAGGGFRERTLETSFLALPVDVDAGAVNYFYGSRTTITAEFGIFNSAALTLELRLKNDSASQTDITLPPFDIQPSGDFVYEEGQDFIFQMRTPPVQSEYDREYYVWPDVNVWSFVYDSTNGNATMDQLRGADTDSNSWEPVYHKESPGHEDWKIRFKTSERSFSGIFDFIVSRNDESEDSLIRRIQVQRTVILRPSSQTGPFPSGYVGIVQEPWVKIDADGTIEKICSIKVICSIRCTAVGSGLSDLEFFQEGADGVQESIADNSRFIVNQRAVRYQDLRNAELAIKYDNTVGDTERFSCVAENSEGVSVRQNYVINYYLTMLIISENSSMELLPKADSTSSVREIRVSCQVQGRPRPEVTFTSPMLDPVNSRNTPDIVLVEGNDVTTFIKLYTVDPSQLRDENARQISAACTSESRIDGYHYQTYPLHLDLDEEVYG